MIRRTALIAAAAASLLIGNAAKANIFTDFSVRIGLGHSEPAVQRVWVEPVYETRTDRIWVEPVYQTQTQRIWHEAVYEDRCDQVLVPDRFETRIEKVRDDCGRLVRREVRVLVAPAHYEQQTNHVLVHDGYYEDVPQQVCVTEGHWAETSRQILVQAGYWADQPVVCAAPEPSIQIGVDRVNVRDDRHDDHRGDWRDDRHDPRFDSRFDRDHRYGR